MAKKMVLTSSSVFVHTQMTAKQDVKVELFNLKCNVGLVIIIKIKTIKNEQIRS